MTDEKHLYLTIGGSYENASLDAEGWQIGVRLALNFGELDLVGTLPQSWAVVDNPISRTESDWTIEGNWKVSSLLPVASFNPDDYLNDQVAPAWAAFLGGTPCSSDIRTEWAKLYPIASPDGHVIPAPPYGSGTPMTLTWTDSFPTGGSGSGYLPLQNSIGVSWRTGQTGRPGRGRIFLPPTTTAALDSHGFLSSTQQTNIRDSAVAFLEALSFNPAPLPGGPHIRPIVTGKPFTKYGIISQVRVDNVIDTQRRRRRQLEGSILTGTPDY